MGLMSYPLLDPFSILSVSSNVQILAQQNNQGQGIVKREKAKSKVKKVCALCLGLTNCTFGFD